MRFTGFGSSIARRSSASSSVRLLVPSEITYRRTTFPKHPARSLPAASSCTCTMSTNRVSHVSCHVRRSLRWSSFHSLICLYPFSPLLRIPRRSCPGDLLARASHVASLLFLCPFKYHYPSRCRTLHARPLALGFPSASIDLALLYILVVDIPALSSPLFPSMRTR